MDVCLSFTKSDNDSGEREITLKEVEDLLQEAQTSHLVARPFRNETRIAADGICFCCDDCCGFFLDPEEKCDKGAFIEETDVMRCELCGACADVCYFKARDVDADGMGINRLKCYGCGLCADVCPEGCIQMVPRLLR
jgi:Pyruvate/2-oxoacid:ferredoxin oxidoreductase delta subunit